MFDFHAHPGCDDRDSFLSILTPGEIPLITETSSIGLLPWEKEMIARDAIETLIRDNPLLMVGEFGLDKIKGGGEKDIDDFLFMADMARSYDRLAVIHSVRYTAYILDELRRMEIKRAIFHSFTGSYELARDIMRAGYLISLSPRSFRTRDIGKLLTLDFLLESDMKTGKEQKDELRRLYLEAERSTGKDMEEKMENMRRELWRESSSGLNVL